ncbi:alpha-glucosidase [Trifolium repens]|nr:alpha-glucosidase [Trifolium repens]
MLLLEIKFGRIEKGKSKLGQMQVKNQGFLKLVPILSLFWMMECFLFDCVVDRDAAYYSFVNGKERDTSITSTHKVPSHILLLSIVFLSSELFNLRLVACFQLLIGIL